VHIRRDTATVIFYKDRIVLQNGDMDLITVTCEGFINRVIYNFPYKMVKAFGVSAPPLTLLKPEYYLPNNLPELYLLLRSFITFGSVCKTVKNILLNPNKERVWQ
jgi:hypothetical protein